MAPALKRVLIITSIALLVGSIREENEHGRCALGVQRVQSALGCIGSRGSGSAGFGGLPRALGVLAWGCKGCIARLECAYLSHTFRLLCPGEGCRKYGHNRTDPPQ